MVASLRSPFALATYDTDGQFLRDGELNAVARYQAQIASLGLLAAPILAGSSNNSGPTRPARLTLTINKVCQGSCS